MKFGVEISFSKIIKQAIDLRKVKTENLKFRTDLQDPVELELFTAIICYTRLHSKYISNIFLSVYFPLNAHQAGHQPQKSENRELEMI